MVHTRIAQDWNNDELWSKNPIFKKIIKNCPNQSWSLGCSQGGATTCDFCSVGGIRVTRQNRTAHIETWKIFVFRVPGGGGKDGDRSIHTQWDIPVSVSYSIINEPASWLAGWLACWLAGWLAGWLACWLSCWLADWLAGLLVGWLAPHGSPWIPMIFYGFLWVPLGSKP